MSSPLFNFGIISVVDSPYSREQSVYFERVVVRDDFGTSSFQYIETNRLPPDGLDLDLADPGSDVPPAAFGGRGEGTPPARRKVWAATKIIEGCWAWLGGDLDNEQRQRLIIAMEAFLDVLRRPYRAERD